MVGTLSAEAAVVSYDGHSGAPNVGHSEGGGESPKSAVGQSDHGNLVAG